MTLHDGGEPRSTGKRAALFSYQAAAASEGSVGVCAGWCDANAHMMSGRSVGGEMSLGVFE